MPAKGKLSPFSPATACLVTAVFAMPRWLTLEYHACSVGNRTLFCNMKRLREQIAVAKVSVVTGRAP